MVRLDPGKNRHAWTGGDTPPPGLRRSNAKFERRVRYIEQQLAAQNRTLADATLIEMEELYQQGKRREKET